MRKYRVVALVISLIFNVAVVWAETTANPKSIELRDDSTLKDVMASQYFKIVPISQVEIKDLKSFVTYKNDNQTIKCSFFKELTQSKVKLALAANSLWENSTGPFPVSKYANPNQPTQKMRVRFEKGEDTIDLACEFTDRLTGMIDDSKEEQLRAACESKAGIFTRYSRKEYDYACDYRLRYADLKKLFLSAGFNFEVRHEPPTISVVVLGGEESEAASHRSKTKVKRLPSSEKLRKSKSQ